MTVKARGGRGANPDLVSRFVQPYSDCEFTLTSLLEGLEHDPWPVKQAPPRISVVLHSTPKHLKIS